MFDLLIKNGRIIDGTGNPWYRGSVGVNGDRIEALGKLDAAEGAVEIDAAGNVIAPGFVDVHTHSDLSFLADPAAQSKLRQGVTTEVVGNCGGSWGAPLRGEALKAARSVAARYGYVELRETEPGEYLDRLDSSTPAVNIAALVGHGTVRACVLGYEDRAPTDAELEAMKELVAESLEAGALGMSTGLYYVPGSYADLDEVVELSRVVAAHDGLVASHIRDESNYNMGLLPALKEAIEVARRSGVRLEIAHLKALGPPVWGKAPELLELLEQARGEGIDVAADQYPYPASGSSITGALIPRWAQADGREAMLNKLQDSEQRQKVRQAVEENYARRGGAERLTVAFYSPNRDYEGKTMAELSNLTNTDPAELALQLLEKADASFVSHVINEEDMHTIARHHLVCFASDGASVSREGVLSTGQPHPRYYGTFPRVLSEFVRKRGLLRLEEAVRKLTSLPAQRIGLQKRGILRVGSKADIVSFDADAVVDRATFQEPKQYPQGVNHVVVNGVVTVVDGEYTGDRAGVTLRSPYH